MPSVKISGGQKLTAALAQIGDQLGRGGTVKVGFLSGATYPDGTSVALVAAVNEFGAPSRGQPPRPFFRNMVAKESPRWPASIAANLKANNYDVPKSLDQIGAAIAGQLRQSIVDLQSPPLKPSTIKRKGFSKPLIDHGIMLQSVSHEVS
jgi:hypothetical protein